MSSIVKELQRDAVDSGKRITDLLRKALVVARKLRLADFEQWLEGELSGYQTVSNIPEYRRVHGGVKVFNPFYGWQPVHFASAEDAKHLSNRPVGVSVAAIEALLDKHETGGCLNIPFPSEIENQLMKGMGTDLHVTFVVDPSQLVSILDSVRTTVLKWALKLEEEGISGEDLTFTTAEKEAAGKPSLTINNFFGSISQAQIQQNTVGSSQELDVQGMDVQQVKSLLRSLSALLPELQLTADIKKELEAEIVTIDAQADSPKPKKAIIRASFGVIQRILEGAAGGATGQLLYELSKILL